jgi:hypothetical protein
MEGLDPISQSIAAPVPKVTLRTIVDGREETLSEYLCDWPGCPHVAVHFVGIVRELRVRAAMCAEHAARLTNLEDGGLRP